MKRTAEISLTVIGVIFNVIGAIGLSILTSLTHTDVFREGFQEGYNEEAFEGGYSYDTSEADVVLNVLAGFGWLTVVASVIGIIAGIIAIFFLKGNKKPKAASIILIVSSVLVVFGTIFMGFIPALLFLIAGIVGLVRKAPPTPLNEDSTVIIEE